jgi:cytochrome c biogenesis protein CcmG/thiol:disulfide interchange protein DsbE
MKQSLRYIPALLFFLLCFFLWRGLSLDPHHLPSVQLGKKIPDFTLPELADSERLFSTSQWPRQVVLLNVWASWCEACTDEHSFMLQLAEKGIVIYGLNYKDQSQTAKQWLRDWGNPYQKVLADQKGKIAIDLGVYGTPETFVIDKQGVIRYRHVGVLTEAIWNKDIAPLLKTLEQVT